MYWIKRVFCRHLYKAKYTVDFVCKSILVRFLLFYKVTRTYKNGSYTIQIVSIIPKWSHFKYSFEVHTIEINYSIKHSIARQESEYLTVCRQWFFFLPPAINHGHWITLLLLKVLVTSAKTGIIAWALRKAVYGNFSAWRRESSKLSCRYLGIFFFCVFTLSTKLNGVTDVSSTKSLRLGCIHRVRGNNLF